MSTVVIIPARLASTRLKNKALAVIDGKPMVQWTFEQAKKANVGDVYVATCCVEIQSVIEGIGGKAILTDPALSSGTDRVYAAYKSIKKDYDKIVNVQGDIPFMPPEYIQKVIETFQPNSDITTLCAPIHDMEEARLASVVKPVLHFINDKLAKALYFSRSQVPYNAKTYYHHLGIYAFQSHSLKKFVELPASQLEKDESLEQLRALENDMTIHMGFVEEAPISVDTQDDLDRVRLYATRIKNISIQGK